MTLTTFLTFRPYKNTWRKLKTHILDIIRSDDLAVLIDCPLCNNDDVQTLAKFAFLHRKKIWMHTNINNTNKIKSMTRTHIKAFNVRKQRNQIEEYRDIRVPSINNVNTVAKHSSHYTGTKTHIQDKQSTLFKQTKSANLLGRTILQKTYFKFTKTSTY